MQFAFYAMLWGFFSRRKTVYKLKMPQSCILRCSVQPVHFYVKMLLWQKRLVSYFLIEGPNLTFQKASQKQKASRSSISVSAFTSTSFMWVCYQPHCPIQLLHEMVSTREKKRWRSGGEENLSAAACAAVLSISGATNSQKRTAYVLFHMLLPEYNTSIRSFIFFSFFIYSENKLLHS